MKSTDKIIGIEIKYRNNTTNVYSERVNVMSSWDNVRQKVEYEIKGDSPKSISTRKHLLKIIDTAEEWDVDPSNAEAAKHSNLREIIPDARKAIDHGDKIRLEELFEWAAEFSNRDLRLKVRDLKRDEIIVEEFSEGYATRFRMEFSPDQFNKIERAMRLQFEFKIKKQVNDEDESP